jgi:hypothetical protein
MMDKPDVLENQVVPGSHRWEGAPYGAARLSAEGRLAFSGKPGGRLSRSSPTILGSHREPGELRSPQSYSIQAFALSPTAGITYPALFMKVAATIAAAGVLHGHRQYPLLLAFRATLCNREALSGTANTPALLLNLSTPISPSPAGVTNNPGYLHSSLPRRGKNFPAGRNIWAFLAENTVGCASGASTGRTE